MKNFNFFYQWLLPFIVLHYYYHNYYQTNNTKNELSILQEAFEIGGSELEIYIPGTLCATYPGEYKNNMNEKEIEQWMENCYEMREDDLQFYSNRTIELLSIYFGGANSVEMKGGYYLNGNVILEKGRKVMAIMENKAVEENIEMIMDYCKLLKQELGQESVAFSINRRLYLI